MFLILNSHNQSNKHFHDLIRGVSLPKPNDRIKQHDLMLIKVQSRTKIAYILREHFYT